MWQSKITDLTARKQREKEEGVWEVPIKPFQSKPVMT
jgi:hypothetical protein